MKVLKTFFASIVVVAVVLSGFIFSPAVNALSASCTIVCDKQAYDIGEQVTVNCTYNSLFNLYAFTGKISYNNSVLRYISGAHIDNGAYVKTVPTLNGTEKSYEYSVVFEVIGEGESQLIFSGEGSNGDVKDTATADCTVSTFDPNAVRYDVASGAQATGISLTYYASGSWHNFENGVAQAGDISAIRINTTGKSYYIKYRTQNENAPSGTYYSYVSSNDTSSEAYAGLQTSSKIIQRLNLSVYDGNNNSLSQNIVVMYRTKIGDEWQPWVSNAGPEWMRSVKVKYRLDGKLNTTGAHTTGDINTPASQLSRVSAIEIHIYEENYPISYVRPNKNSKIINAPHIYQMNDYPTGCESVSTVEALNYMGYDITVNNFIDNYLARGDYYSFDPDISFGGNPYGSGMGCYAPVIKSACDILLSGTDYYALEHHNVSLDMLCSEYIDNSIPVIMWATMYMYTPYVSKAIQYEGRTIYWIAPEHCLLLVGYDDYYYYFSDPMQTDNISCYLKSDVESAYRGLYMQAVVIMKNVKPSEPEEKGAPDNSPAEKIYQSKLEQANIGGVSLCGLSDTNSFKIYSQNTGMKLDFTLTYNSLNPVVGNFGSGFSSIYFKKIEQDEKGDLRLFETPSSYITYSMGAGGFYTTQNFDYLFSRIVKTDDYYIAVFDDHKEYYDASGNLSAIVDSRGRRAEITKNDNILRVTDTIANKSFYFYLDENSLIRSMADDNGEVCNFRYENGLLKEMALSDGTNISCDYNSYGLLTSARIGSDVIFATDFNQELKVVSKAKDNQLFEFSENSGTTTVTNGRGIYTAVFDDMLRLVYFCNFEGDCATYGYDEGDLVTGIVYGETGDTNSDGRVDILDFIRLKKAMANNSLEAIKAFDINSDGMLNGQDAVLIRQYILGADYRYINAERFSYDTSGRIISFTDTSGLTVKYSY